MERWQTNSSSSQPLSQTHTHSLISHLYSFSLSGAREHDEDDDIDWDTTPRIHTAEDSGYFMRTHTPSAPAKHQPQPSPAAAAPSAAVTSPSAASNQLLPSGMKWRSGGAIICSLFLSSPNSFHRYSLSFSFSLFPRCQANHPSSCSLLLLLLLLSSFSLNPQRGLKTSQSFQTSQAISHPFAE
jgi:hypothetical protein